MKRLFPLFLLIALIVVPLLLFFTSNAAKTPSVTVNVDNRAPLTISFATDASFRHSIDSKDISVETLRSIFARYQNTDWRAFPLLGTDDRVYAESILYQLSSQPPIETDESTVDSQGNLVSSISQSYDVDEDRLIFSIFLSNSLVDEIEDADRLERTVTNMIGKTIFMMSQEYDANSSSSLKEEAAMYEQLKDLPVIVRLQNNDDKSFFRSSISSIKEYFSLEVQASCGGNYGCGEQVSSCTCSSDSSVCNGVGSVCGEFDAGTCQCEAYCSDPKTARSCTNLSNQSLCTGDSKCPTGTCLSPGADGCSWDASASCPTGFIWCEGCNACMENTQTCNEWEAGGCTGGGDGSGGDGGGAGSCSDWCTSPAECGENGGTIVSQPCSWDSCSSGEPCYVPPNPPQEPGQVDCSVGTKTITMQVGETRVINPRYGLNQPYEWNWVERRGQNVTKVGGSSVNIDSVNTALPGTSGIYSDGEAQITATSPGYTVLQMRGTGGNEIDGVCTCSNVCCGDEIDYTFECTSQWTVIVEQPEADPWMQISNGNVFSAAETGDAINAPVPLACDGNALCTAALLTENAVNTANSDGFAITGGGSVSTNGFYNERTPDPTAIGSALSRIEPNYQYFYRLLELPENPADDFAGSHSDARRPNPFGTTIDDQVFFSDGDLTIQERWWVPDGGTVIVVVDGDLTFENPSNYSYLSEVVPGGFLMFVVSGDIIVDETVGHANNSTARSLAGFFVTNGQVDIQSTGNVATERTFIFEGSVVAWNGFSFSRDLGDAAHAQRPAELFRYRPDLLLNTPEYLKEPQQTWQEVN